MGSCFSWNILHTCISAKTRPDFPQTGMVNGHTDNSKWYIYIYIYIYNRTIAQFAQYNSVVWSCRFWCMPPRWLLTSQTAPDNSCEYMLLLILATIPLRKMWIQCLYSCSTTHSNPVIVEDPSTQPAYLWIPVKIE